MIAPAPPAPPGPGPARDAPPEALAELLAIYRDLDQTLASLGVKCRACGRCCDFLRNDYRLYASHIERAIVLARAGRPALAPSGECGFLSGGRCSAHAWRPLGCRVFFCAPEHKAREQDLCHAFQQRIRAATERHGLPWDYRPFFEPSQAE